MTIVPMHFFKALFDKISNVKFYLFAIFIFIYFNLIFNIAINVCGFCCLFKIDSFILISLNESIKQSQNTQKLKNLIINRLE
jgi:hypothetical protein